MTISTIVIFFAKFDLDIWNSHSVMVAIFAFRQTVQFKYMVSMIKENKRELDFKKNQEFYFFKKTTKKKNPVLQQISTQHVSCDRRN